MPKNSKSVIKNIGYQKRLACMTQGIGININQYKNSKQYYKIILVINYKLSEKENQNKTNKTKIQNPYYNISKNLRL